MYCRYCGHEFKEGERFCPCCGPAKRPEDPAGTPSEPPRRRGRVALVIVIAVVVLLLNVVGILAILGGGSRSVASVEPAPTQDFVLLDEGFTDEKVVDEESARKAVVGSSAGLDGDRLGSCSAQESPIGTVYRFQQLYQGVPVEGRTVVVVADDAGTATMLSSNARDVSGVSVEPTVSEGEAEAAALSAVEEATSALPGGKTIRVGDDEEPAKLCWKFLVPSEGVLAEVLVSAESGEVLEVESGWNSSSAKGSGYDPVSGRDVSLDIWSQGDGTYRLYDKGRETSTFDVDGGATSKHLVLKGDDGSLFLESGRTGKNGKPCYYDVDQKEHEVRFEQAGDDLCWDVYDAKTGELLGKSTRYRGFYLSTKSPFDKLSEVTSASTVFSNGPAVAAASRAASVHDFYASVLGRAGHDDEGGSVTVIVNDTFFELKENLDRVTDPTQSMSTTVGGYMVLTFGVDASIADDLVAHEFTHGVEKTTSELDPKGESGALKEAMGDLMGQVFEDWRNDGVLNNNCDWLYDGGLRNLADPAASISVENRRSPAHPSRVGDAAWGSPNDEFDNGYVHNNSTVVSHACYLMCVGQDGLEGGSLTTEQLAQLVYTTLFALPSDCSFSQYRTLVERVATIMARQSLLTAEQVKRVTAAFDEAGITPWEISADSDRQVEEDVEPTVDALSADRERAAAFLGKLDELIAQYGDVRTSTKSGVEYLSGTCFAKLVDFGDGVERLVVAYNADPKTADNPFSGGAYVEAFEIEVWEYDVASKGLKLVASGDPSYTNAGFPYVIVGNRSDGGIYLVTEQPPNGTFWGILSDGTFGKLPAEEFENLTLDSDERNWLMSNPDSISLHGDVDDTVKLTKDTYDELAATAQTVEDARSGLE